MGRCPGEDKAGIPVPALPHGSRETLQSHLLPWTFLLAVSLEPRAWLARPLPGLGRFQTGSHLSTWPGAGSGPNVFTLH